MFGRLLIPSTPSPSTTPAVALASEQTLIDMAKDNSQSSKQSKSSSKFNISRWPFHPTPSEQNQEYSSKSRSLWPKLFSKSRSTTSTQSGSSLPLVSSTVDSRGETAWDEHPNSSPFVLLSKLNVESSIPTTSSGMRRTVTSQMAYSLQS